MITISICVGSACHLKGSYKVIEGLQKLIKENKIEDKVEIKGAFCIGRCTEGVSVTVNDDEFFSLNENNVDAFFHESIMRGISNE
ncbi:(2Fe-2S) ferredoxin domain-containing protein [Clostridium tagluense]|uniref:(2Fe-2S) ferredoxin domain-containing protein n=1 Tax=Clostridium tagluense TaxID=360422 RepID=UPI001C6F10C7|nr:(2Fe-2S) ferredoxin domain-containing protein [Clostridium tagluense]MBW9156776.1 (2Fe-2S) ferredoxin domain-containing protein [Clostridium tagluense]MCB2312478.1 (2Fe-2S) ferredoxin domain-containing protein [Clostridium tagluense]MCB2317153.1 (2Fe-2S) ferredoxin domain-containing protein [Clostridium tagluense]MCB2322017.1 (2Fe-2S) ferredoxin domain-containing protein [Clostridium tagluense]MCB2327026.1 (2Fe-2S) ferredoxin domain-containing protein [Clostridium tagluense]